VSRRARIDKPADGEGPEMDPDERRWDGAFIRHSSFVTSSSE